MTSGGVRDREEAIHPSGHDYEHLLFASSCLRTSFAITCQASIPDKLTRSCNFVLSSLISLHALVQSVSRQTATRTVSPIRDIFPPAVCRSFSPPCSPRIPRTSIEPASYFSLLCLLQAITSLPHPGQSFPTPDHSSVAPICCPHRMMTALLQSSKSRAAILEPILFFPGSFAPGRKMAVTPLADAWARNGLIRHRCKGALAVWLLRKSERPSSQQIGPFSARGKVEEEGESPGTSSVW
ncbi:hypothetical protein V8C26DRAFT_383524 [Trichoderma gracile]